MSVENVNSPNLMTLPCK